MRLAFAAGLALLACCLDVVRANTEKVIFLGPETVNVPATPPTLDDLRLDVLTPDEWSKRVELQASFPTPDSPLGTTTWLLLNILTQGQRYELRVCWAATQPTAFALDVFELPVVWDTPELISSLATYASLRRSDQDDVDAHEASRRANQEHENSLLFLRVSASADYFTDNDTLMAQVEPVSVDLILDPFLFNVLPRSLVPTVAYVVFVAFSAWFLSKRILAWIQPVLATEGKSAEKKKRL
ncbi:hypothetical protein CORC01_12058 [Colletotrichum orchidophilum]|uniref:Uncharacterized protein n=1 Tax=Colletotrichum orchidophilum TaxID=1209926 RepID=A0A1G4AU78_9PEZI|nr:uncharacterized protein CORC01_12058 [Colletotrichum orchidophilum]OHE92612.1 hypothetical protein CORC01_12058 [Colletotrichum orchidophilum]